MNNVKKSNVIYISFIAFCIPILILTAIFSGHKSRENYTLDYDRVFEIGGYRVKINDCVYISDKNKIYFTFKVSPVGDNPSNSKPEISSVTYGTENKKSAPLQFTSEQKADTEQIFCCTDFSEDFWYIQINFYSKDADYTESDTVDEFGDVIKGEFHEGKEYNFYVVIDKQDMKAMTEKEFKNQRNTDTSSAISDDSSAAETTSFTRYTVPTVTTTVSTTSQTTTSTVIATPKPSSDSSEVSSSSNENTSADNRTAQQNQGGYEYNYPSYSEYYEEQPQVYTTHQTTAPATTTTAYSKTTTMTTRIRVISIKLSTGFYDNNILLSVGESHKISAVISPDNAEDKHISWSSNRTDIAAVDAEGNITAVSKGKAIITATTNDGGLTASCMVTVS